MSDPHRPTLNLDKFAELAARNEPWAMQAAKSVRELDGVAEVVRNAQAFLQAEHSAVEQAKLLLQQNPFGVADVTFRRHEEHTKAGGSLSGHPEDASRELGRRSST